MHLDALKCTDQAVKMTADVLVWVPEKLPRRLK